MQRLKQVKPQIQMLGAAVRMSGKPVVSAQSDDGSGFKKTARWQRLRWNVLVKAAFTCQWPGCGRIEVDTSLLVADHIVPWRVEPSGKWDENNLQCLCKACHDGPKQAIEVATYGPGLIGRGRGGVEVPKAPSR